jgi:hypothetical protein
MPEKRSGLNTGHRYEFVCLQIDIAGHSRLTDAERTIHAAKERFRNQINGTVTTYSGQPFKWEGDGGAFLFQVTDGREFGEAVFAAFRILESLPGINEEIRLTAGLSQTLAVRISLDSGQAVYDKNPGLITGDFLNAFLKNERAIGLVNEVTVSERIHRQLSGALRERFGEYKGSDELGCRLYRSGKADATTAPSRPTADREAMAPPGPSSQVPPTGIAVPSPAREQATTDRTALIGTFERLTPADFASVVTRIPGAAAHISRHGTLPEHIAELLRWAESPTGPGLASVAEAFKEFRPRP